MLGIIIYCFCWWLFFLLFCEGFCCVCGLEDWLLCLFWLFFILLVWLLWLVDVDWLFEDFFFVLWLFLFFLFWDVFLVGKLFIFFWRLFCLCLSLFFCFCNFFFCFFKFLFFFFNWLMFFFKEVFLLFLLYVVNINVVINSKVNYFFMIDFFVVIYWYFLF